MHLPNWTNGASRRVYAKRKAAPDCSDAAPYGYSVKTNKIDLDLDLDLDLDTNYSSAATRITIRIRVPTTRSHSCRP